MAMTPSTELDPIFRYALKLLHSPNIDSAEKIRNALDDIIKTRHGASKMLVNTLNKKYLAEESASPGSGVPPLHKRHRSTDSKSSSSKSSSSSSSLIEATTTSLSVPTISDAPIMLALSENDTLDEDTIMEDDQLKELEDLEDLTCVVCRRMDVSARNRLVECADCHSLYHQECHKPQISETDANDQENSWFCTVCKTKNAIIKNTSVIPVNTTVTASPSKSSSSSSHSSSSHKSSSKNYDGSSKSKSSSSKNNSSSSKTSNSSNSTAASLNVLAASSSSSVSNSANNNSYGKDKDNGNNNNKGTVTPNINIISADKRLQNMKKKAAKMHETKRKHK